jgi:hypothetical protein
MAGIDLTDPVGTGGGGARLFPSMTQWLLVMAGMSVLAIVIGAAVGLLMAPAARRDAHGAATAGDQRSGSDTTFVDLPTIITNLGLDQAPSHYRSR